VARCGSLLLVAAAWLVAGLAASENVQPAATGLATQGWPEFRSELGRFAVRMPGPPKQRSSSRLSLAGRIRSAEYLVEHGAAELRVEHHDLPAIARFLVSSAALLKRAQQTLVADEDARELHSVEASLHGYPARRVSFRVRGEKRLQGDALLALVGSRLYILEALQPPASAGARWLDPFFQSFRVWER
jgi:hypothetical protein